MLAALQRCIPAAQCSCALYLEATTFNAGFISTNFQTKKYKGTVGVIENLEGLLSNSKLAKKTYEETAFHILEAP